MNLDKDLENQLNKVIQHQKKNMKPFDSLIKSQEAMNSALTAHKNVLKSVQPYLETLQNNPIHNMTTQLQNTHYISIIDSQKKLADITAPYLKIYESIENPYKTIDKYYSSLINLSSDLTNIYKQTYNFFQNSNMETPEQFEKEYKTFLKNSKQSKEKISLTDEKKKELSYFLNKFADYIELSESSNEPSDESSNKREKPTNTKLEEENTKKYLYTFFQKITSNLKDPEFLGDKCSELLINSLINIVILFINGIATGQFDTVQFSIFIFWISYILFKPKD